MKEQTRKEAQSTEHPFLLSLKQYLDNLQKKINFPEIREATRGRIFEIIDRNNLMSGILEGPNFLAILEEEKKLKGNAKVGVILCIDGRLSILHQFGVAVNTKEVAGSLIGLSKDKKTITDRRFISILEQNADEGRELLEIVTAHKSSRHKNHGCGRISLGISEGEFIGDADVVAWTEAEKRVVAIENKYNEILKSKGKAPQNKVAIAAMVDTDTMGLTLNYNQDNQLNTTDLTLELASDINQTLGHDFGSMRESFTNPSSFIEYSKKVLEITEYLMSAESNRARNYINENYSDLSDQQNQALLFTVCRTIANQYVTGLASEEEFYHPYLEHNERYMVVSPVGKLFGRFDFEQSFGCVPKDRKEMLEHIKIELKLLDKNRKEEGETDILFISTPINLIISETKGTTITLAEDAARVYFQNLLEDEEIKQRIEKGLLVIVPILVDENSGKVLKVRDYSIHLN